MTIVLKNLFELFTIRLVIPDELWLVFVDVELQDQPMSLGGALLQSAEGTADEFVESPVILLAGLRAVADTAAARAFLAVVAAAHDTRILTLEIRVILV